jgi:predicted nucleotidyltransferase
MQNPTEIAVVPEHVLEALVSLCRRYRVKDLALFGSAAGAGFEPGRSDIDLLVEFEPMPSTEHMQNYFGLLEALEALFRRRVDLVERASVRNPYVLESIVKSKVPLYAAA